MLTSKNPIWENNYSKFGRFNNQTTLAEDPLRPDVNHLIEENFSKNLKKRDGQLAKAVDENTKRLHSESRLADAPDKLLDGSDSMGTGNTQELSNL